MSIDTTPAAASKAYKGSCHCGAVAFTATLSPPLEDGSHSVINCNCSICARNGYLFAFCPSSAVEFSSGENSMTEYAFGKRTLSHWFCPTCGTSLFGSSGPMKGVNVRALEEVDLNALTLKDIDGKNM